MTLQEAENKLSELNTKIDSLLVERESILKEWNLAFESENPEKIICVDENAGSCHNLYLVNGESRMHVCMFDDYDLKESMDNFYKRIDTSNVYS